MMNPDFMAVLLGSLLGFTLLCAMLTLYYCYRMMHFILARLDHLTRDARPAEHVRLPGDPTWDRRAWYARRLREAEAETQRDIHTI